MISLDGTLGQVMRGEAGDAQIGAFLMGLRMKGESLDEITGAARSLRLLLDYLERHPESLLRGKGPTQ